MPNEVTFDMTTVDGCHGYIEALREHHEREKIELAELCASLMEQKSRDENSDFVWMESAKYVRLHTSIAGWEDKAADLIRQRDMAKDAMIRAQADAEANSIFMSLKYGKIVNELKYRIRVLERQTSPEMEHMVKKVLDAFAKTGYREKEVGAENIALLVDALDQHGEHQMHTQLLRVVNTLGGPRATKLDALAKMKAKVKSAIVECGGDPEDEVWDLAVLQDILALHDWDMLIDAIKTKMRGDEIVEGIEGVPHQPKPVTVERPMNEADVAAAKAFGETREADKRLDQKHLDSVLQEAADEMNAEESPVGNFNSFFEWVQDLEKKVWGPPKLRKVQQWEADVLINQMKKNAASVGKKLKVRDHAPLLRIFINHDWTQVLKHILMVLEGKCELDSADMADLIEPNSEELKDGTEAFARTNESVDDE